MENSTKTIGGKLPCGLVLARPDSVGALRAAAGWRGVVSAKAHGYAQVFGATLTPAGSAFAGGAPLGIEQPNPGFPATPRSMRDDRGLPPWRHRT